MCGIFYVESLSGSPLEAESLRIAEELVESRGPSATISGLSSTAVVFSQTQFCR